MRRILIAVILSLPSTAVAQQGGNIDLQAFRPAMDSRGYITVNASQILGHKEISFGLVTNWGFRVLELEGGNWGQAGYDEGNSTYAVENIITPELVFAFGLFKVVELGVSVPFTIVSGDVGPDFDGDDANPSNDEGFGFSAQGVGDI